MAVGYVTNGIFMDIAIIIILATLVAYVIKMLRQPLIPAYVITGVIIGPLGLRLITDINNIKLLAELGIAFMLFVVGLELDFTRLKTIGFVASFGGTIQVLFSFVVALLLSLLLGFEGVDVLYMGVILAFSSTLVVIKMLSDKKELDTLHGRIIIGILLVQDVFAILALSALSTLHIFTPAFFLIGLTKGLGLVLIAILCSKYAFPAMFKSAARTKELLFLLSITVVFIFAILSLKLGFSIAIGGFLAGIALGNLPYSFEIISRVTPLRDFFATLFFVTLGMELMFSSFGSIVLPIAVFLGFILVLRPLIILVITNMFGYATKVSFQTAISLAQISEFALIIATQGLLLKHVSQEIFSITVITAIITIGVSSYFIQYDKQIFRFLSKPLSIFDKIGKTRHLEFVPEKEKFDAVLIGCDRLGYTLLKTLQKIKKSVIVVDFNPDIIRKLIKEKIPSIYGDIGEPEVIERIDLKSADMIITTSPDINTNEFLIKKIKNINKKALLVFTASTVDEALKLYNLGADYVILPHFLGGKYVSFLLQDATVDVQNLLKEKTAHIKELHERKHLGHEHPSRERHR